MKSLPGASQFYGNSLMHCNIVRSLPLHLVEIFAANTAGWHTYPINRIPTCLPVSCKINLLSEVSAMDLKIIGLIIALVVFVLAARGRSVRVQERAWIQDPSPSITGDVECFSEYMELWVHRMKIEGLRLWLSGALRIPVSLASLEHLNFKLSACGFSLHRDAERNYVFRVLYSGCFVQLEQGNYIISLNLMTRTSRFGGWSNGFVMKCPRVTAPPSGEHIHCDPDFIEVTRQIPTDNWNNQLPWSLALRGKLVVALEDASLISLNVETHGANITVQGRRSDILTGDTEMERLGEFLPLRLVSGHYSYSMEAVCPNVSRSPEPLAVLHILKRRMGLVKRSWLDRESLTLSGVSVSQTDAFIVSEGSDYVQLIVNTSHITTTKNCPGSLGGSLVQPFFRVDAAITFKETPHRLYWSLENFLPCRESASSSASLADRKVDSVSDLHTTTPSAGGALEMPSASGTAMSYGQPNSETDAQEPLTSTAPPLSEAAMSTSKTPKNTVNVKSVTTETPWNVTRVSPVTDAPATAPPAGTQRTPVPTEVPPKTFLSLDPVGHTGAEQTEQLARITPGTGSGSEFTDGSGVTPTETPDSLLTWWAGTSEPKEGRGSTGRHPGLGLGNNTVEKIDEWQPSDVLLARSSVSGPSRTAETQLANMSSTLQPRGRLPPNSDLLSPETVTLSHPPSPSAASQLTPSEVMSAPPNSDSLPAGTMRPSGVFPDPVPDMNSFVDSVSPLRSGLRQTNTTLLNPAPPGSQLNGSSAHPIMGA
ncbi:uncharacterized protein C1orf127 homolog isoform X2 [Brienomyrus brachyistius]|uniref:uncharacterized protein C1orf127 homolog isoform X2 n=1 Tax=Brienomyrus brachyistius TaxID=42636 RepID=UPI0020B29920|nr:uncharacterized protein C1orf127 homolog isoform X2 [Brienomyrus brachyistius]